ncbi:hypothetical protein MBLNU13_g07568t1 [Cladosporium sp. NU13]
MHFLTAPITTLLFTGTGTLAIILPDNFTIIEIVPFDRENLYKEARGNPNVPLINATLRCSRDYKWVYEKYEVTGEYWHGVSEKQLKNAAKKGGLMTGWEFESWEKDSCDSGMMATVSSECPEMPAGWRAKFNKPTIWGRPKVILEAFEKLTGMFGENYSRTEFLMSNGTAQISSFTWEDYPEENQLFVC